LRLAAADRVPVRRAIYDYLFARQEGACAGCGRRDVPLVLDHAHDGPCGTCKRTRVWDRCGRCERGLLCESCNRLDVLAGQEPVELPPELLVRRERRRDRVGVTPAADGVLLGPARLSAPGSKEG
jgi:hypothetical protein